MANMTVLEIVVDILNDLEEDVVNSINDSVAALEVAQIVKTTYFNIIDSKDWPHLNQLFQFTGLGNINKPNYLQIPDSIVRVDWVKYNIKKVTDTKNKIEEINYLTPEDFVDFTNYRTSSDANIQLVQDFNGIVLNIRNDKRPEYFTSFDDKYIVFDSFDSAIDTTIQASKSNGYGRRTASFTVEDSFTPDLPQQMFSYLLNEAKATAFLILKQSANAKAEQHSITQRRRMSQDAWKLKRGITYPNYGRKK